MVRLLARATIAGLPATLSLSAALTHTTALLPRCARCFTPLLLLAAAPLRARLSSTASSPSSAAVDPLEALRAQWPSALPPRPSPSSSSPSSPPPPPISQRRRPSSPPKHAPKPLSSARVQSRASPSPSSSASSLSAAEARALSLAQREAASERQRAEREQIEAEQAAAASSASRTSSRLPPLLDERGRVAPPSTSSSTPSASSSQLHPFDPLTSSATSSPPSGGGISEEEKAEQLALIDELTDYLRTFRHPTADKATPSMTAPSSSIIKADFFYDRPHSTLSYNHFINNHALHQAVDAGLHVPQLMQERGVPMDVDTFSALAHVCGAAPPYTAQSRKEELAQRAGKLLAEMKQLGLAPSVRFFNSLLEAWTRLGATSCALTVPSLMAEHGLAVSTLTFTSLLSLYRDPAVSFGQLREWWSSMRSAEGVVDVVAYNCMIRAAAHHGEAEYALQLFTQLQASGLHASAFTYNSLMYACAKRPDFYLKAFELYQQAIALQFQPDAVMTGTLLYACALNSDLSNAIRLFEQMETANVPRDTIAYNCMLQCIANTQTRRMQPLSGTEAQLSQAERMDMSERLLIQMEANGVLINERTVYLALKVYTNALRLRVAESKREELIRRYVRCSEEEQREQGKGEYSPHLWLLMLTMYTRARRLDDCKRIVDRMDRLTVQLPTQAFEPLLHLCSVKADGEYGSAVLQRMRQLNLKPASAELERLFDIQLYRKWRRAQMETKKEGAVPALDEAERQRIRDSAWFGHSRNKQRTAQRSGLNGTTAADGRRAAWRPSNMERRAKDSEIRVRRRREKSLQEEAL